MSRRRERYRPHVSPSADELAFRAFGARHRREPADVTILPPPAEPGRWQDIGALALAVGAFAFCVATWCLVLPWIAGAR